MGGDYPTSRLGPPVTLDWAYEQDADLLVDAFEKNKKPRDPILSYYTRGDILIEKEFYRVGLLMTSDVTSTS